MKITDSLAILLVLIMLSIVACARHHQQKSVIQRCQCINNLRIIGGALEQFRIEHGGWPMQIATNNGGTKGLINASEHYSIFRNYFATDRLVCPTDTRTPAASWDRLGNTNLSYFIATEFDSDRDVIWAGDRNFTASFNTQVSLASPEKFRWYSSAGIHHGKDFGVLLVDSNPESMDSDNLLALIRTVSRTNVIQVAVP